MHPLADKYLRKELLPFLFCPGCGDGVILHCFLEAVDQLGVGEDLALISGIGCSSWMPFYIKADCLKILHGRTIPVAMGLKLTRPTRVTVVFTGDGDCLGIGGNHFIHAARRNLDITVIMINNQIYAMTGGQAAPTSPLHATTQTTPYGNPEMPLDGVNLAIAAGATFVSRWSTAHPRQLTRALKNAMKHRGFAYVEVIAQCPVQTGRYVMGSGQPSRVYEWIKESCLPAGKYDALPQEQKIGKFKVGDFLQEDHPDFCETIRLMNQRAREQQSAMDK
jgi:2-oxoglutarate ferredoxin oxidoreductase subunit beta